MANISKISGLVMTGVNKVSLVVKASVKKICGVERITLPSSWYVHFDNTQWSASTGSWATYNQWEGVGGQELSLLLTELGTWVEGYRPTQCRITIGRSVNPRTYFIQDSTGSVTYGSAASTDQVITFNLNCSGDIGILRVGGPHWVGVTIAKIEFYGTS